MTSPRNYIFVVLGALLLSALSLRPAPAAAQLLEVKQTVFGMDCAPCAYGLEKRLKKLEGVAEARVSLNEGLAAADLANANRLTLGAIRDAIRESGFSAEDAVIRAEGTLEREGGRWVFVLPAGERFAVDETVASASIRQELEEGPAVVEGTVAKGEPDDHGYTIDLIAFNAS